MTYRVPGLLSEDLSKFDHVRVVVELFGKVNHLVCAVLLRTRISSSKKCTDRVHGDRVTLVRATGGSLYKESTMR